MLHRLALTAAAAALLAAGSALAQASAAAAAPPAPPPAQVAPPAAEPPAPAPAKAAKEAKHGKHEKAKGHGTPQTHHCVKDGKVMADLTNKKCVATGGVWQRDAEKPVAPPAPVPAPKP